MNTLLALLLVVLPTQTDDLRAQLSRKWLMIGVEMNGKKYGEAWLERQRQNGLASVLEFQKSGACQVHVYTKGPQGRSQRKTTLNKWQLSEDQTTLTILTEGAPPQVFKIIKASNKRLMLAMETPEEKQVFTYKAVKD
ncbi:MAG: hypothetical protein EAZ95_03050 [Bacteroidetes bacterium]|nr:MAG: hypothetical protein EAZ95_03050 [Bacteroidota bacterium]